MMKRAQFFSILYMLLVLVSFTHAAANSIDIAEHKKLVEQAVKVKNFDKAALYSFELAEYFYAHQNLPDAKNWLTQSLSHLKKVNDADLGIAVNHLMASITAAMNDHSVAAGYYEKTAELAKKQNKSGIRLESLVSSAESYMLLKKNKKAIEPLEEALSITIALKNVPLQLHCLQLLSENHKKTGNTSKAAEYYNQYQTLQMLKQSEELAAQKLQNMQQQVVRASVEKKRTQNELVTNIERLKQTEKTLQLTEQNLQYKQDSLKQAEESLRIMEELNQKRQLEIDILNKDKELANLRLQEQNARLENEVLLRNATLVVILLAVSLITVLVINYRKSIKTNKKIDLQNKNIKSSINYAKRIQDAMLPKKQRQEKLFPQSFILFQPRDVVSGDFYWFSTIKNHDSQDLAFAAMDCTGHGVPGAFMSMIGMNSLNKIINKGITETNLILDSLHQEIRSALQQEETGNNDGMDAAFCIWRKDKKILEFSGAKNPLVYIKNNELHQIKGDHHSIGGNQTKAEFSFKKHEVVVDSPVMVYLFTDGYRDQFGGKDNQKFMSKKFSKLLFDIHDLPLEKQQEKLKKVIDEWKGHHDQTDDILVFGVRIEP